MDIQMTPDVNVILMDFPNGGNEMVVPNEDGSYTILINARLSYDGQMNAYKHGMNHINDNDFEKIDVQEIEYHAHNLNDDVVPEPAVKYLERIKQLQREQRRIQRKIREDQERVRFITQNCDMFKRAEHQYLY